MLPCTKLNVAVDPMALYVYGLGAQPAEVHVKLIALGEDAFVYDATKGFEQVEYAFATEIEAVTSSTSMTLVCVTEHGGLPTEVEIV